MLVTADTKVFKDHCRAQIQASATRQKRTPTKKNSRAGDEACLTGLRLFFGKFKPKQARTKRS